MGKTLCGKILEKYPCFHVWFDAEESEEEVARDENLSETDH